MNLNNSNQNGGAVTLSNIVGDVQFTGGITTRSSSGANSGDVKILCTGNVTAGTLDTSHPGGGYGGHVTIGTAADRVGSVTLSAINTSVTGGGGGTSFSGIVTVYATGAVSLAGGINISGRIRCNGCGHTR